MRNSVEDIFQLSQAAESLFCLQLSILFFNVYLIPAERQEFVHHPTPFECAGQCSYSYLQVQEGIRNTEIFLTRNRIILAPSNQRQVQIFLLGKSLISAIALACVSLKYLIRYQSCSLPVSGEAAVNAVSISLLALQN